MKTILLSLFVLISFSSFAQLKNDPLQRARELRDSEQYRPALGEVNQLLIRDSSRAEYYDFRAEIYMYLKLFDESLADYNKAVSLQPYDPIFYHHRSTLYYAFQKPDDAIVDNMRALQLVKDNDSAKFNIIVNLGNDYSMKRDFQKAYDCYLQALNFDSTNQAALINMGAICDDLGKEQEGLMYLERVVRLYPDDIGGYGNLAFRYAAMGQYQKALELDNKVLQMNPKDALGYNNRGYVKYKLNDLGGAMADVNYSLQLYPENSYAYKNRALIYIALKQFSKACDDLKMSISLGFTSMYGDEVAKLLEKYCAHNN